MGKFYKPADYLLGLFCATALAFPSLAIANQVSVDVSPTTGYTTTNNKTFGVPARSSVAPASNVPLLESLPGGGASQTMKTGITITALNEGGQTLSSTITSKLKVGAGAMKNAAGRCLTSFRCNLAIMAGSAGLEALFDGLDWVMGEGGQIQKTSYHETPDYLYSTGGCADIEGITNSCRPYGFTVRVGSAGVQTFYCQPSYNGERLTGFSSTRNCLYGGTPAIEHGSVAETEILEAVDSSYTPQPSDLPFLATGGINWSEPDVEIEITDIPSISGENEPNFIEYSDGTSLSTYSEYDFDWGAPGKQPEINVREKTHTTTYDEYGAPVSSSTATVNVSGSAANAEFEVPTDCEFMPTVCRFIDWFTSPDPEVGEEPDIKALKEDIDPERSYDVGASTAACPAPLQISLSMFPSVEISLQPLCDFVDLLRPLLLALAWYYYARVILGA